MNATTRSIAGTIPERGAQRPLDRASPRPDRGRSRDEAEAHLRDPGAGEDCGEGPDRGVGADDQAPPPGSSRVPGPGEPNRGDQADDSGHDRDDDGGRREPSRWRAWSGTLRRQRDRGVVQGRDRLPRSGDAPEPANRKNAADAKDQGEGHACRRGTVADRRHLTRRHEVPVEVRQHRRLDERDQAEAGDEDDGEPGEQRQPPAAPDIPPDKGFNRRLRGRRRGLHRRGFPARRGIGQPRPAARTRREGVGDRGRARGLWRGRGLLRS